MITIRLTAGDWANTRFSYSPLLDLVSSYRVLNRPEWHGFYWRWVDEASRAIHGMDFPYLSALTADKSYIPDFLTPTPTTVILNLEDEIQRMRAVPADWIRKNIQYLMNLSGDTELLTQFMAYPHELLECLIDELRLYWELTLAHHWSQMTTVLDSDILYRARQAALGGTAAAITDLHPGFHVEANQISYDSGRLMCHHEKDFQLNGDGMQLVPAIFTQCNMWQMSPEWRPMLIYTPRGTGLWWENLPERADQSLELTMGTMRARILRYLETPANTGEVARQLRITAGAASQHLSRMNQAGLVEPRRTGKRVYYNLTQRGEDLLKVFS